MASHEARHLAAAVCLGWRPLFAELREDGSGFADFRAPDGLDGIRRLEQHALIVLCGAMSPHANAFAGDAADKADLSSLLKMLAERSRKSQTTLEDELRARASWLIEREQFKEVARSISGALLERGRLDERELSDLVDAALEPRA